jgi:Transposase DDE domain
MAAINPDFNQALARVLPYLKAEIVKRSDQVKGFVVLSKRWIVACTFAWLNRCHGLVKDSENLTRKSLALLHLASIRLTLRKVPYEASGQTLKEGKMSYEPYSKDNYRASRLMAIWMQANVTKAARVPARFS